MRRPSGTTAWDVAVVGAGPAGAVAARVLAHAGARVVLVDQPAPGDFVVGESLPGAAHPLLRDLGLLDRVEEGPHLPSYGTVSAWGTDELRATDSLADPHGPGWHLDRARFDDDLRAAARESDVAEVGGLVRAIESDPCGWRLVCRPRGDRATETTVTARWLIDATGRRAAVARQLGVRRQRDDRLVALCAWTASAEGDDRDSRTMVEAAPDGWWYTAPLPGGHRVVVLHGDADDASEVLRRDGAWAERLAATRHVRHAVGDTALLSPPRATEACGARLDRFAGGGGGPRWLAVGDAALSFDPLSSQGLFDALYTGLRGAQAVLAALDGSGAAVAAYAERLESVRAAYLAHHRRYYAAQGHWRERPFWSQRRA